MKKIAVIFLCLLTCFSLTACGYRKPDKYSVKQLSVDSITTVCQTDCSLGDTDVTSTETNCTATYYYTDVANDSGIADAKKYHDYLAKNSLRIDDFDEKAGSYTAYIGEKKGQEGISIKVVFTKDTYAVTVTDNVMIK